MVAQVAEPQAPEPQLDSAKTLICALNFLSRNLPLPQQLYDAVSSIAAVSEVRDGDEAEAPLEEATETRRTVTGFMIFFFQLHIFSASSVLKFVFQLQIS